jgi:hypothetical protein
MSSPLAKTLKNNWTWISIMCILFALEAIVFVCWSTLRFGSLREGVYYLWGDRILLSDRMLDVGKVRAGDIRTLFVTLSNVGAEATTIERAVATRRCTLMTRVPVELLPGRQTRFYVELNTQRAGTIDDRIHLSTGHPASRDLIIEIKGEAVNSNRALGISDVSR